jgi:hypothetical protein
MQHGEIKSPKKEKGKGMGLATWVPAIVSGGC